MTPVLEKLANYYLECDTDKPYIGVRDGKEFIAVKWAEKNPRHGFHFLRREQEQFFGVEFLQDMTVFYKDHKIVKIYPHYIGYATSTEIQTIAKLDGITLQEYREEVLDVIKESYGIHRLKTMACVAPRLHSSGKPLIFLVSSHYPLSNNPVRGLTQIKENVKHNSHCRAGALQKVIVGGKTFQHRKFLNSKTLS